MKQDMILILDLGSEENPKIAREIRALGVYTEIHPHDITAEELAKLPGVKGIILNGGVNRVVDGVEIDASEAVYNAGLPILKADHKGGAAFPADDAERETVLKHFVFDTCKAEANWNMENFIADQIELIKRQVGDKKVLLALSGGVDSSVVAALLIRAIGKQLTCVHVNHGLLRKGEPEPLTASWISWQALPTPNRSVKSSARNLFAYSRRKQESWKALNSSVRERFTPISSNPAQKP